MPLLREGGKKLMIYPLSSKKLTELQLNPSIAALLPRNDAQWVRSGYLLTHRCYMVINFLFTFEVCSLSPPLLCFQDIFLGKVPQKRDTVE